MIKETHKFKVSVANESYYFLEIKDETEFEIEDLKQLVEFEKQLSGKILPVLIICPPRATTNNELINYLSKDVSHNPYSKADAFVLSSLAQKILANVYTRLNKPQRPVKFFNEKGEALKWLMQFKND